MNRRMQLRHVRDLVYRDMPWKEYHNPMHADDVSQIAGRFARLIGMDEELVHLHETAGLYHDVIHVAGAKDNEEQSAMYGKLYLPRLGYKDWELDVMGDMIVHGTKMPQAPRNTYEMILADADVYNAGRDDFLLRNDLLRVEFGAPDTVEWDERSLEFLKGIRWRTEPAREYGERMRQRNIERLEEKIAARRRAA